MQGETLRKFMLKVKKIVKKEKKPVVKTKSAVRVAKTAPNLPKPPQSPQNSLTISVLDVDGKPAGKMTLPQDLFGVKVNKPLLAQAIRVYLANQRSGGASTKTRGEVEGSTRKIYKQKGTGKARHGGIRAPIFVGGGITFGPKPRDFSLNFPKSMKKAALGSALTSQLSDGNIIVVDGLEKLKPKTKFMAKALTAVGSGTKALLVTANVAGDVVRSARNLAEIDTIRASSVNAYTLIAHKKIIFMKEAIREL